jgi:hypothetical protein
LQENAVPTETAEEKHARKQKSKADRKMFSDHSFVERPWDSDAERSQYADTLANQGDVVNDYWKKKYETDAKRNWDLFYKR